MLMLYFFTNAKRTRHPPGLKTFLKDVIGTVKPQFI